MADNSFLIKLGLDASEIAHGVSEANKHLVDFKEQIIDLGKSFGAVFAVERVAEFTAEISELAAKASGVKSAFNQLPDAAAILEQMRETTHDTVSDLDLMGKAVRAENLKIPLEDLGTLLEFAHVRALATNQDFNTLADTLLKAIGKGGAGAKKAMAELQISTEDYNEALKATGSTVGAVMKIAQEEIEKTSGKMDKTLHAIESNAAAWENLKESAGEALNESGVIGYGLNFITDKMKILNSDTLSWWVKLGAVSGVSSEIVLKMESLQKKQAALKEDNEAWAAFFEKWSGMSLNTVSVISTRIQTIGGIQQQINDLLKDRLDLDGDDLSKANQKIKALQEQKKLLEEQGLPGKVTPDSRNAALAGLTAVGPDSTHQDEMIKKNEELAKSFEETAQTVDDFSERATTDFKFVHDSHNLIAKDFDMMQKKEAMTSKLSKDFAADLTNAFVSVINGSESFTQAIGHMAEQFGAQMLAMALAGIIESAMNPTSNGGNYYVALALAGAGIAAVGALFSKIGVKGGGGSSGGMGGAGYINPRGIDSNYSQLQYAPSQVEINGTFKVQGPDLVATIKNANRRASIVGGN